ncbi:MAG: hypothetical protein UMV23_03400 [Halanaerobium sp.]|nr:hypothetical protein [Halanaerobium sp.]
MRKKKRMLDYEKSRHKIILKQLGGQVEELKGSSCYVKFNLDGLEIVYLYHINLEKKFFLKRVEPYPLGAGIYESEDDVIDIIKIDLEQFKNAMKSKKFNKFIEINRELNNTVRKFDDLYLYYNVSGVNTEKIRQKIMEVDQLIDETREESKRVFFKKDPDVLK